MKIVQINAVPYGSTGRMMFALADRVEADSGQALCTAGFTWQGCSRNDFIETSNIFEKELHTCLAWYTGKLGEGSSLATNRLLHKIKEFAPDVIHLHNLHGWFINYPLLFDYLKRQNKPVIWTLHDCWSFTGQCPHFMMAGCNQWQTGCGNCTQYHRYPSTRKDFSRREYQKKRMWFTNVNRLTIVTPSHWLAGLVGQSFLAQYPVQVIHNGIDLTVFRPVSSNFRKKNSLEGKFLLLGVAYDWDDRKGLDIFLKLAQRLDDRFRIVLVGTNDRINKRLPPNILGIHRTQNPHELAEIYSAANVFLNPTREDNYPTVNMEALACGTPVLTFATGGSPEIIDQTCGAVLPYEDVQAMQDKILQIARSNPYTRTNCLKRAKTFDQEIQMQQYIKLYRCQI